MTVAGSATLPPHQTGGMVHTIQNMVQWCTVTTVSTSTPHYTTTWSGGGGSRDQSDAERLEPGTMPTCDKIAAGDTIRDGRQGHGIGRVDGYLVS